MEFVWNRTFENEPDQNTGWIIRQPIRKENQPKSRTIRSGENSAQERGLYLFNGFSIFWNSEWVTYLVNQTVESFFNLDKRKLY